MTIERLAMLLALTNLFLLAYVFAGPGALTAQSAAPVLRGRALEIVDDQGRVRATLSVLPASPGTTLPAGQPHPETVLLRLIDRNGRPGVKLAVSELGAGLSLVGEFDATYVVLKAEGPGSSLKLTDRLGRQQTLQP